LKVGIANAAGCRPLEPADRAASRAVCPDARGKKLGFVPLFSSAIVGPFAFLPCCPRRLPRESRRPPVASPLGSHHQARMR
jgi:hypothetical protein